MHSNCAKGLMFYRKRGINDIFNVVIEHPIERFVQIGVHGLYIVQRDWFIKKHFVKRRGEPSIDVMAMEDCCSDYTSDEMEVRQVIWIDTTVWINL